MYTFCSFTNEDKTQYIRKLAFLILSSYVKLKWWLIRRVTPVILTAFVLIIPKVRREDYLSSLCC